MVEPTPNQTYSGSGDGVKTLAVRIREDLRAQLDIIAQLNDRTVTEEMGASPGFPDMLCVDNAAFSASV